MVVITTNMGGVNFAADNITTCSNLEDLLHHSLKHERNIAFITGEYAYLLGKHEGMLLHIPYMSYLRITELGCKIGQTIKRVKDYLKDSEIYPAANHMVIEYDIDYTTVYVPIGAAT